MSRLAEIMDNHEQLDKLNNLLKHYGVNAEFVTAAVLEQLQKGEENGEENGGNEDLVDDMKQLFASL